MTKRKNHETVTTKKKQMSGKMLRANKKYKDTVFRMLFSDRENLLSLYNAINGTTYENPEALEIVTLENAIYMGMKNDLAFIVDTNLFLYEHQKARIRYCRYRTITIKTGGFLWRIWQK